MKSNLRHLRAFLEVAQSGSITQAALRCKVSQPAVTQAIAKLERMAGLPLFLRKPGRLFPTEAGLVLQGRANRAFARLDPALSDFSGRLRLTATSSQLTALIALVEAENFTLAAHQLGLAQPTVHRAVTTLELEAGRPLFERTAHGVLPGRMTLALAQAAQLAFAELEQAAADLAELAGAEIGRIVIGAMPLSRAHLLPRAIAKFRNRRPTLPIRVLDGPYHDLIAGLRRGEIDFLIGALRDPPPVGDIQQTALFEDRLVICARPGHPLAGKGTIPLQALFAHPMVLGVAGVPARRTFDRLTAAYGPPNSLVETGSMVLMRELLRITDHIGCISQLQIARELAENSLIALPVDMFESLRPIGLTLRQGWLPTRAQAEFIEELNLVAAQA